jgi:ParB-like chromosome segregation protein Spo0J
MNIKKMQIDELIPADYNPRKDLTENDKEYQKLKRSIQEFGYVEPVIFNQKTGVVVGGHQRLKVLKDLGHDEVDCVVVDIDDTKEKALNIALNKISGEWDFSKLKDLLLDIDTGEIDISLTGFDLDEIERLMTQFKADDFGEEFELPEGDKAPFQQMTFTLADEQAELIKNEIANIKQSDDFKYCETFGNENSNGNALYCLISRCVNGQS